MVPDRLYLAHGKVWYPWLGIILMLCVLAAKKSRARGELVSSGLINLAVFAFTGLVISYILAVRSSGVRYLLPSGFSGIILFILASHLWLSHKSRNLQIAVTIVGALFLFIQIHDDIRFHENRISDGEQTRQEIIKEFSPFIKNGNVTPTVLYSYRVPQPSFALRIFSENSQQRAEIESRFPNEGHYIPWLRKAILPAASSTWDYLVIRQEQLASFPEPVGPILGKAREYLIVARKD